MSDGRVVAVGLLPQGDLDVLGTDFRRLFAVDQPESFADLLHQLDEIAAAPVPSSGVKSDPHGA